MSFAPSYSDLGKDASDLFNKGYDYDAIKIEIKPKSPGTSSDVKCSLTSKTLGGILSPATSPPLTTGLIEIKNKCKYFGVNTTTTIRQNSQITTEITKELLANKGKLTGEAKLNPSSGALALKSKGSYKNEHVNGSIQLETEQFKPPTMLGNIVLSYKGFLLGSQLLHTYSNHQVPYPDVSVGYQSKNKSYGLNALWSSNKCMMISTHQRIDRNLEIAFQGIFERNNALHPRFNVAARYAISDAIYKVKVNSQKLVGLSYSRLLQPGIKFTLSSIIDFNNFAGGNHRLGVAFDFE
ncbi:Voltage-dependent anion-selective channel protein 1 [Oopsacas minuta]|uniref:Voltage-dependent anion-selective channel protein 1 n=1 Tax=Oopsacas minuta TaxID=111878 RepID=A0AAV7K4S6_9METZ|nr:Voltage-dependent anion-selective channel protein 1 [Oopsacas minuta]